jgi:hypothetical protein
MASPADHGLRRRYLGTAAGAKDHKILDLGAWPKLHVGIYYGPFGNHVAHSDINIKYNKYLVYKINPTSHRRLVKAASKRPSAEIVENN